MDRRTNQRKTLLFLNRGDSFGEQAIMTRSIRQTTVISRERIELLTISDTVSDYNSSVGYTNFLNFIIPRF